MKFTNFEVSHVPAGWLKIAAKSSKCCMVVTPEVVPASSCWLNLDAVESALNKSTIFEVSQVTASPLKLSAF